MVCVQKEKAFLSTNRCWPLSKVVADTRAGAVTGAWDPQLPTSALLAQCLPVPSVWTADMTNEATALLMGNNAARLCSYPFFRAHRG